MRISFRAFITASATCALLAGCANQAPTQWIAHGYKYDDNTPITSPAPSKPWLKDAVIHDTEKLAASTAAWQGAVYELTGKLFPSVPASSGPVYLQTRVPATPQKQALDHYLRQALIQRGYSLAATPGSGPVISYDVMSLENDKVKTWAVNRLGADAVPGRNMKDVYLLRATAVAEDGHVMSDEAVVAVIAGEKTEYMRYPGYSNQPVQGKTTLPKAPVYLNRD